MVAELGDNSVNLTMRFFALNEFSWDCHWYSIEEAKLRLESAGSTIPFPQREVHFYNHSKQGEGPID